MGWQMGEESFRASEALDSTVSPGSLAINCLVLLHGFEHPADERTPQPSPSLSVPRA